MTSTAGLRDMMDAFMKPRKKRMVVTAQVEFHPMKLHEADQIRAVERFALGNLGKVKVRHVGEGKNRPGPGMSFQLFFDPQEFFGAPGSDPG